MKANSFILLTMILTCNLILSAAQQLETIDVDAQLKQYGGRTPLIEAIRNYHSLARVRALLERSPAPNPNATDAQGGTPLMSAVLNEHPDVVELLVKAKDIDVNKCGRGDHGVQKTALKQAKERGLEEIVNTLKAHGAKDDVNC